MLGQSFKDFEFLIVDDGSTDETPAILQRYADRDSRIRLFLRPHRGIVACRNELLQLGQSDIVACVDSDDMSLPDRFQRQFDVIAADEHLVVLGTAFALVDSDGTRPRRRPVVTGSAAVARELLRGTRITQPTCMMRKAAILAIGGYRPAYEAAEDYDLFLRASECGKVDNLNFVGVHYRVHDGSVSREQSLRQTISSDLARATHALRVEGKSDPTQGLLAPPELDDPIFDAVIPAQIRFHRAVATAFDPNSSQDECGAALRYFLGAPLSKKQVRGAGRAIARLIKRRRFDALSAAAALRAVVLRPEAMLRPLWS